jgi:hypothetical protein
VTRLIHHCHGHRHWHHLCLHSWDDGTKDYGRGDRRGHHADICGWEEVGHHDPIGVKKQKQKPKQKQNKNKINNTGSNLTASAPADSYTRAATAAASAEAELAVVAARA